MRRLIEKFIKVSEVSNGYDVALETKNRIEFIKVSHLLAKGLDVAARRLTLILLTGQFDVWKSLVADSIMNALDDAVLSDDDKQRYRVPKDNKMILEPEPASALKIPARGFITIGGEKINIFLREALIIFLNNRTMIRQGWYF